MADQQPQGSVTEAAAVVAATTAVAENESQEILPVADDEVENTTFFQSVTTAAFSLATTALVYALGYWRIASASTWVLLPLITCVQIVRNRWRQAGRIRRRRAQLFATSDEKELIAANVSELPSWVFFPDIHRAEWLNQVSILLSLYLCLCHDHYVIINVFIFSII